MLALEAPDVIEEVMHFLDRSGARVIATAHDDRQLEAAVRQLEPDVVVAQPTLAKPTIPHGRLLALDTHETVRSLRAAIDVGADAYFVWPADREALAGAALAAMRPPAPPQRRAAVLAVHGSRGGVGTTFVVTHLAATFSRSGRACVVLDLDPLHGDLAAALGAPMEGAHTLADLLPLMGELAATHLEEAMWTHPEGFRTLLPPSPEEAVLVGTASLQEVILVAAEVADVVILDVPRSLPSARFVELADRIVEVLTPDVLSVRAAARDLEVLGPVHRDRVDLVLNRASRQEVGTAEIAGALGAAPRAVIGVERALARAQDHGTLLSRRSRPARRLERLARELVPGREPGPG